MTNAAMPVEAAAKEEAIAAMVVEMAVGSVVETAITVAAGVIILVEVAAKVVTVCVEAAIVVVTVAMTVWEFVTTVVAELVIPVRAAIAAITHPQLPRRRVLKCLLLLLIPYKLVRWNFVKLSKKLKGKPPKISSNGKMFSTVCSNMTPLLFDLFLITFKVCKMSA